MTTSCTRPAKKPAPTSRAKRGDLKAGAAPVKADAAPVVADAGPVVADGGTIRQALDELGLNRPYYACRVAGSRLEFVLYGGDVVTWPAEATTEPPTRRRRKS